MKSLRYLVFLLLLVATGCITQFIPETGETQELLVVEGLITDQSGGNTVKLSKSMPLGKRSTVKPLRGCTVIVMDDKEINREFPETAPGIYTAQEDFKGIVGRKYILYINTNGATGNNHSYKSLPMELKPVPPIDSIYYEKVFLEPIQPSFPREEGCQIFLNTQDAENNCKFYRWDYTETWEFRLPFSAPVNSRCWISSNSGEINIKNISGLAETRINKYPVRFISNQTDRLKEKYSMLINQYSVNEDEFTYWEKLQSISEEIGSLYDITPSSIPGNIYCIEDPGETVLGYFSVSARTSKRVFINDYFAGIIDLYGECISDTIYGTAPIPDLNITTWALEVQPYTMPPYTIITHTKGCADCSVRGSIIKPDYWDEDKK